jgi:peptide-methionine (R)-S-oxide reductase
MGKIIKSDSEWKAVLTAEQYRITRGKGTEMPSAGEYLHNHEVGVYQCVCCGKDLFDSEAKYDSGSGWPSFWKAITEEGIEEEEDRSLGMRRIEIRCSGCDAHLGHVFDDGPEPTGRRYCVNSGSLKFAKAHTATARKS